MLSLRERPQGPECSFSGRFSLLPNIIPRQIFVEKIQKCGFLTRLHFAGRSWLALHRDEGKGCLFSFPIPIKRGILQSLYGFYRSIASSVESHVRFGGVTPNPLPCLGFRHFNRVAWCVTRFKGSGACPAHQGFHDILHLDNLSGRKGFFANDRRCSLWGRLRKRNLKHVKPVASAVAARTCQRRSWRCCARRNRQSSWDSDHIAEKSAI